jgi:hypothetical protein
MIKYRISCQLPLCAMCKLFVLEDPSLYSYSPVYAHCLYQPVGLDQYESIRHMAEEITGTAPDARVLTTYYCGPSDSSGALGSFEAFLKVPTFLRPHTQIFCTRCKAETQFLTRLDSSCTLWVFGTFVRESLSRKQNLCCCCSEWVLGGREELVGEITKELQPENREVGNHTSSLRPFMSRLCLFIKLLPWS